MRSQVLIQLDTDAHPSSFDAVVAIDAGVGHLLPYGNVTPDDVPALVHGAMFTRGGGDLARTAIFVGGSDVAAAERLLERVTETFFGPVRVSVMLDANGCNTTAAAAVVSLAQHLPLSGAAVAVLGGTGPVGRRVAEMAAGLGAKVVVASRQASRAAEAVAAIEQRLTATENRAAAVGKRDDPTRPAVGTLTARQVADDDQLRQLLGDCDAVVSAGAAGVQLLSPSVWQTAGRRLRVAVDLSAVPPAGIAGIGAMDKAKSLDGRIVYGAIGVGGLKMKTHRRCLQDLFAGNDLVLDSAEVLSIAQRLVG